MMPRAWTILGAVAFAAAAFIAGYRMGAGDEADAQALRVAAIERERNRAENEANRAEAERLALQAERDALVLELEDAARADADASLPALSATSVQRLMAR